MELKLNNLLNYNPWLTKILGHDVKPCDQNLGSSWYYVWIHTCSTSICVAQDAPKIHVSSMLFEVSSFK
jgi:hypothetical protein